MFTGLAHTSPQKLFKCILYFLAKSPSPRVDDKDFSQRPEQEPKEKAIKKSESSAWEFKHFFYPRAYNGLLKWRSFRKLLEGEKKHGFL